MKTFQKIQEIVAQIPYGKVATYGQIAKMAHMKNPRIVGFAIHKNTDPISLPCHRVVNRDGFTANGYGMGGRERQTIRLRNEGIEVDLKGRVDLTKYLWTP